MKSRFLFAKFVEKKILGQQGRLLFSLLNAFASGGYQIWFFDNSEAKNLPKLGQLILSLENLKLTDTPPKDTTEWIYIFDKEDKRYANYKWLKKLQVRDNIFSSYWTKRPIILPFSLHPIHFTPDIQSRLTKLRSHSRHIRIFFSGDTKGYQKNWIQYPKAKLPRLEIMKTIREYMDTDLLVVREEPGLNSLFETKYTNKCVIMNFNEVRVDWSNWLNTLSRADFFLSPPGYVMPMCHNIIEAMALGTIPITNYPEWFDPSLTHMENCIVFDDRKDLIGKLKMALQIETEQIAEMRAATQNYYDEYLRPDSFIKRIESRKKKENIVLIYTVDNVARNHSKLNKNSILLSGARDEEKRSWIKHLIR
jgi:hypothetical protein